MKKKIALLLALILCATLAMPAYALDAGEKRAAIGANLDQQQIEGVYVSFGVEQGSVKELTVTNADERTYLEGLVPDEKIGTKAISCVYIETLEQGSGLKISTNNINWCTSEMYQNALTTAGITDARVLVSAPFAVSGTAALTGIYKAYEDITGKMLSEDAKSIGAQELVVTGELAEYIGSEDATKLVNELKGILTTTQNMSDEDVRAEISRLAEQYNVSVTDGQVEQLLSLCRKLEKLDVDALRDKLISLTETVKKTEDAKKKVAEVSEKVGEFSAKLKTFFGSVGEFFAKLF